MMKVAPLYHALQAEAWAHTVLVHTGQHYDDNMSGSFLRDFNLPDPHFHLNIGSGTYAEQTGRTMVAYEALCHEAMPDICIVVGDVNATIACAISAKKMNIPVAHLEAGLRSFDRTMPEEINRLATDAISDFHWTPSPDATRNLRREGVAKSAIAEVGNIMIDAYRMLAPQIAADAGAADFGVSGDYAVCTFHRPANVDTAEHLVQVVDALEAMAARVPVIFPVHPRTYSKLGKFGLATRVAEMPNLTMCAPLHYVRFMSIVAGARVVVTDSGGVQEETSYLGVPCLTLRTTTERPTTISEGTNRLTSFDTLDQDVARILRGRKPKRPKIKGWDGHTAERVVHELRRILLA